MRLRDVAELAEQAANRADQTIGWLEEHEDEIGDPDAVRICIRKAVEIRTLEEHKAELFREVEEVIGSTEPMTFDLTPSRKRQ
jgi:hypothetical protein